MVAASAFTQGSLFAISSPPRVPLCPQMGCSKFAWTPDLQTKAKLPQADPARPCAARHWLHCAILHVCVFLFDWSLWELYWLPRVPRVSCGPTIFLGALLGQALSFCICALQFCLCSRARGTCRHTLCILADSTRKQAGSMEALHQRLISLPLLMKICLIILLVVGHR